MKTPHVAFSVFDLTVGESYRMMKLLLLICPLLLIACTPQAVRMDLPGTDESTSIPIKDVRPSSEKESGHFSLVITSSAYGIYRKGDATLNPPMIQIFRRLAFEKFGDATKPLDISVHHMVVYVNMKSEFRKMAALGTIGGAVGGAIAGGTVGSTVNLSQTLVDRTHFEDEEIEEHERAFYTDAANPEHASVFVIYIDAEINGKRTFVKTMAPTKTQDKQDGYVAAVKSAIGYFLSYY
ncbi:MAG: hypothetical protein JSS16_09180 [Proteobacteria bacterium]|nr:hypothetical protein [Pseudomonadota bacterium]